MNIHSITRFTLRKATRTMMVALASITLAVAVNASDAPCYKLKATNESFYSALNTMFTGKIDPMLALWSHGKDVAYLGPDGLFLSGWNSVKADWHKQAAMKLGGKAVPTNVRYFMAPGSGIAVVQDIEQITTEKGLKLSIRATNVYRMEGRDWKMVSHHTDKLPSVLK
ncbi:MAG: nuclear transport factor 2 family protein [bacterium]